MNDVSNNKPTIAIAMMQGLGDAAFGPDHWRRLETIGTILNREVLTTFDDERAASVLADADVLLGHWGCPTLTGETLALAPRLRMFAYAAGTVKWQVTDAVWQRNILVTSAAAANAIPVAEYTVAMILLANKGVFSFREKQRNPQAQVRFPKILGNVRQRVGIIGASFVGRAVIELLGSYRLDVAVYDPYLSPEEAEHLGVELVADLVQLCGTCNVVSLHAPDIEATRGMLQAVHFAAMPDGATFINTARPALIDQDALTANLVGGRISAVLDVSDPEPLPADHPLVTLANVFVTPHIAGSVGNELSRMADLAIDEIEHFTTGRPPLHPVTQHDLDRIA